MDAPRMMHQDWLGRAVRARLEKYTELKATWIAP